MENLSDRLKVTCVTPASPFEVISTHFFFPEMNSFVLNAGDSDDSCTIT